jgi:hypothetical protein
MEQPHKPCPVILMSPRPCRHPRPLPRVGEGLTQGAYPVMLKGTYGVPPGHLI